MSSFKLHYPTQCCIIYIIMNIDEKNTFIDKRIIKTKNSIKNAFLELVVEKDINKISVSDLAAKALVNRSTFYLHYEGVDGVAQEIEEEISARIESCIEDFDVTQINTSVCNVFRKLTSRLDEVPLIKKYIISSTNSQNVIARLKEIFAEKTESAIVKKMHISQPDKYAIIFAASGIVDCYIHWVRSGDQSTTLDKLINEISSITELIIVNIKKIN